MSSSSTKNPSYITTAKLSSFEELASFQRAQRFAFEAAGVVPVTEGEEKEYNEITHTRMGYEEGAGRRKYRRDKQARIARAVRASRFGR